MRTRRTRSNSKTKSMASAPAPVQRFALFGPPPLLEGEDGVLYEELLGRMCAAVKPVDIIDEMLVADVVSLQWEVIRWRRLKFCLLQASVHDKLAHFLNQRLNYEAYAEIFESTLAEILRDLLEENRAGQAAELAHQYARSEPDVVNRVRLRFKAAGLDPDNVLNEAKAQRAKELVQEYGQREPEAIKLVNELLASSGQTIHELALWGLSAKFDEIERIDRLITIAETRRNVSLREIDRRRAVLGEALRQKIEEVEDAEFEVIETPPTDVTKPRVSARSS